MISEINNDNHNTNRQYQRIGETPERWTLHLPASAPKTHGLLSHQVPESCEATKPRNRSKPWPADTRISIIIFRARAAVQSRVKRTIHATWLSDSSHLSVHSSPGRHFLSILCLTQFPRAYGLLQHGLTIACGILRQHNIDKQFSWNDDSQDSTSKKCLNYVTRSCRIDPVWLGKHKRLRGKLRGLFLLRMCTTCWDSTPNKRT